MNKRPKIVTFQNTPYYIEMQDIRSSTPNLPLEIGDIFLVLLHMEYPKTLSS